MAKYSNTSEAVAAVRAAAEVSRSCAQSIRGITDPWERLGAYIDCRRKEGGRGRRK